MYCFGRSAWARARTPSARRIQHQSNGEHGAHGAHQSEHQGPQRQGSRDRNDAAHGKLQGLPLWALASQKRRCGAMVIERACLIFSDLRESVLSESTHPPSLNGGAHTRPAPPLSLPILLSTREPCDLKRDRVASRTSAKVRIWSDSEKLVASILSPLYPEQPT